MLTSVSDSSTARPTVISVSPTAVMVMSVRRSVVTKSGGMDSDADDDTLDETDGLTLELGDTDELGL